MEKFKPSGNRIKTEAYKSGLLTCNPAKKLILGAEAHLPGNFNELDYWSKQRAQDKALDDAICKHLTGEVLTDHEKWHEYQESNINTDFINSLPNK